MLNLRRYIKPLKWCTSHINHKQTVSTWSHLANHFNSKPEGDRWAFLKNERTVRCCNEIENATNKPKKNVFYVFQGLLGFEELKSHEGFYLLQENVISRCDELVEEIISPNRTRKIVEAFDELSDTLCKVADVTEFIRLAHPSSMYSCAAEEACFSVCKVVEKYEINSSI